MSLDTTNSNNNIVLVLVQKPTRQTLSADLSIGKYLMSDNRRVVFKVWQVWHKNVTQKCDPKILLWPENVTFLRCDRKMWPKNVTQKSKFQLHPRFFFLWKLLFLRKNTMIFGFVALKLFIWVVFFPKNVIFRSFRLDAPVFQSLLWLCPRSDMGLFSTSNVN